MTRHAFTAQQFSWVYDVGVHVLYVVLFLQAVRLKRNKTMTHLTVMTVRDSESLHGCFSVSFGHIKVSEGDVFFLLFGLQNHRTEIVLNLTLNVPWCFRFNDLWLFFIYDWTKVCEEPNVLELQSCSWTDPARLYQWNCLLQSQTRISRNNMCNTTKVPDLHIYTALSAQCLLFHIQECNWWTNQNVVSSPSFT